MPYRSRSHPDELLFLKVGGHTLFLIAKVSKFDGPVVFSVLGFRTAEAVQGTLRGNAASPSCAT